MRNCIEFSIPLALGSGATVQTSHCKLTADYFEGFVKDAIQKDETILLDFIIGSAGVLTESIRREYLVTHAHPEEIEGHACTWFMAVPKPA